MYVQPILGIIPEMMRGESTAIQNIGADPERFTPEQNIWRPSHVHFPFGEGSHLRIGNTFAMTGMQLILTMTFQRFELTLIPDQQIGLAPEATLRPKHGMRMDIEPVMS